MFSPLEIIQKKQSQQKKIQNSKIILSLILIVIVTFIGAWEYFVNTQVFAFSCIVKSPDEKQKTSLDISFDASKKWKIPFTVEVEKLRDTIIILNVEGKNIQNKHSLTFTKNNKKILLHLENYQGTMSSILKSISRKEAEQKLLFLAEKINTGASTKSIELTFASLLENLYSSKSSQITYHQFIDYSTFLVLKIIDE